MSASPPGGTDAAASARGYVVMIRHLLLGALGVPLAGYLFVVSLWLIAGGQGQ